MNGVQEAGGSNPLTQTKKKPNSLGNWAFLLFECKFTKRNWKSQINMC